MEEELNDEPVKEASTEHLTSLYSDRQYYAASFFGGPITAGIMFYKDFKAIGKDKQAIYSLLAFLGFTVFMTVMLYMLPESTIDEIPKLIIPLVYSVGAMTLAKHHFSFYYDNHNYNKRSNLKAAGISLLGLVFSSLILFSPLLADKETVTLLGLNSKTFGKGNQVYYDDIVDEKDVDIIGRVLVEEGLFSTTEATADIVLREKEDKLEVTYFVLESYINDVATINDFSAISRVIAKKVKRNLTVHLSITMDEPVHTIDITYNP